jgi:hypothetical protein
MWKQSDETLSTLQSKGADICSIRVLALMVLLGEGWDGGCFALRGASWALCEDRDKYCHRRPQGDCGAC